MEKKTVVKIEYLSKYENAPRLSMTPSYLRLLAQRSMEQLEARAERKAKGIVLPEDEVMEFTEWL